MIQGPSEHQQNLEIEVAGLPVATRPQQVLADLDRLRAELNVYRGHLLDVSVDPMAGLVLPSPSRPVSAGTTSCCPCRRARPGRAARGRGGRAPGGPCSPPRAAPQARLAAVRPARHRQDAHHALPARPDDELHPAGPDRPVPDGRRPGRRPGPRHLLPAAASSCSRTWTCGRGTLPGPGVKPGVLFDLLDAMDGAAARRRPAVPADHQPRRPAGATLAAPAGAGWTSRSRSPCRTPRPGNGC